MPVTPSDLKGLRRRLDEIDDKLQDLLIDRAQIVSLVAASKKDGNRPALSTGPRGRNHPPARRTSPWRPPCRNSRSHVAGDVGSNGPVAIPFFGRRIRPCRSAGVLGSGARPLRQQHADVGLRHRGSGDPRSGRRNRLGRRLAAAEGRRTRSVVAAFAVDRRRRAAGRRAPAVRCARQRPCRYRCAGDRVRRTRGERSRSHLARCGMFRGDQPAPDLGASARPSGWYAPSSRAAVAARRSI